VTLAELPPGLFLAGHALTPACKVLGTHPAMDPTEPSAHPAQDRPLSGMANFTLLAGATAAILLFYFFVVGSLLVLLVVLAVEFVILIALLRFGMVRLFVPVMQSHGQITTIFLRSLWLGKSTGFQIRLRPEDAPELFTAMEGICGRAGVPLPHKVILEMGVNAWVRMKGYRRGAGTTILGVGYDLLAGLSQAEFEGVLGHEMMHAKLVQRGFRQLLTGGIARAARLTNGLGAQVAAGRQAKRSDILLRIFHQGTDRLTRLAARQVAACSRQDEFDADRGAAELCGAAAIRSSLLKLEGLNRIASRLQLRERIAQLESGEGFSPWLVRELAAAQFTGQPEVKAQAFNKYSTHPSLHDRLAALSGYADQTLPDSPPAIGLLAHPDEVAEKLVAAIQKNVVAQEEKDSKQLDRWSRKTGTSSQLRPMQAWGCLLTIIGVLFGGAVLINSNYSAGLVLFAVVSLVAGIAMFVFGKYREKVSLPVPEYALIKAAAKKKFGFTNEQIKELENEMRQSGAGTRKGKQRADFFVQRSHEALAQCDYVRAHIAARFCLEQEKKSIPGTLAFGVAAGGIKQGQQVGQAVRFVRAHTGMKSQSPSWGAGWALLLVGDWIHAEAFLEQARVKKPGVPTVLALLAISQSRRGKLFSAIASARKAHKLQPADKEYAKLLIDLLLQGGFLREASELLHPLVNEAMTDTELMFAMVKLCLLQHEEATADDWIELVRQSPDGPHKFVTLGEACEATRHDEKAVEHFQQALTTGHYPEALLGLGRLEAHRQNKEQAGAYFLAALDLLRPLGENSVGPVPLVGPILQQLKQLQEPILNCRAWIAALPRDIKPAALAGTSFLVYAPNSEDAKRSLETVLGAMQPDLPMPAIRWSTAAKEQQPDGPVLPGIQTVFK